MHALQIIKVHILKATKNINSACTFCYNARTVILHPVRKQIVVRAFRRINNAELFGDLDKFSVDQRCVDVDIMNEQYDKFLSDVLDKHSPMKNIL